MTMSVCASCGQPCTGTYCEAHRPVRRTTRRKPSPRRRDVGTTAWKSLSRRARRAQPFCTRCGSTRDLAADHSPRAWARTAAGLPIRLADITVLCRRCNNRAGSSKPGSTRYTTWLQYSDGDIESTEPDRGWGETPSQTAAAYAAQVKVSLSDVRDGVSC